MADGKKIRKYLLRIVEILFSVALLVMLAVSLILAKPQEDKNISPDVKPAAETGTALRIRCL